MGFPLFLRDSLSERRIRVAAALVSVSFAATYSVMIGIVFRLPFDLPESFATPSAMTVLDGPFGQVPMLVVYLDRRWVFSINPEAFAALSVLTLLVGLNTASIFYLNNRKICPIQRNLHFTWAAAIPSFFSFFTCCGGGLVFSLLLSAGAGLSILGFLQDYGRIFTAFSSTLLATNLYLIYSNYRKNLAKFSEAGRGEAPRR